MDYFSASETEIDGSDGNILISRRPNMSDAAISRRVARNKASILEPQTISSSSTDLLGSILDKQAKFHSKNSIISIKSDGTLKFDVNKSIPLGHDQININNGNFNTRQTPMEPNTTNGGNTFLSLFF